jgi:transposase InsO family protein
MEAVSAFMSALKTTGVLAPVACHSSKASTDACGDEFLNEEVFDSLAHVRQALGRWRHDYNNVRPHSALGGITPATARRTLEPLDGSAPGALAKPQPMKYSAAGLSF